MKKLSDSFIRRNTRILAIVVFLFASGFAYESEAQTPPPVLTIEAEGISARFSNYSLTDYGIVNGRYRGTFCFSLTNDSNPTSPGQLPQYLIAAGIQRGAVPFTLGPSSIQGSFTGGADSLIQLMNSLSPIEEAVDLQPGFLANNAADPYLPNGPNNGIPPGQSASFCLTIESAQPFSLNSIIASFTVAFSNRVAACYVTQPLNLFGSYAELVVTEFSHDSIGFVVANSVPVSPVDPRVLTGIGFNLPEPRRIFRPLESGTGFSVSDTPARLRLPAGVYNGELDFGLLTGGTIAHGNPRLGVPHFAFRFFRIRGEFDGLTTGDFLSGAVVRFEDAWGLLSTGFPARCSSGGQAGGVRAAVATNPR